ncbi:MAG: ABC transporter permease subunit [Bulleidia sp.]
MLIRKELKNGLMNFIIWAVILCGMFGMIFILYPYIIDDMDPQAINAMLEMFPESVLKAFNMDMTGIDSAFGWLKSEGFVFLLLGIGCYSALLGSSLVLKEENDHTIEYLHSLPVTRFEIVWKKYVSGLIYVVALIAVTSLSNCLFLELTEGVDAGAYWTLAVTPLFPCIVLYGLSMLVSVFFHRSRTMMGISLGMVFISYILNMAASLSETTEFLKYFSVFTLADVRNVMVENAIDPVMVVITAVLSAAAFIATSIIYRKKELM